jgi:hypothetical protein
MKNLPLFSMLNQFTRRLGIPLVMEWMPPPDGIAMCQAGDVQVTQRERHP